MIVTTIRHIERGVTSDPKSQSRTTLLPRLRYVPSIFLWRVRFGPPSARRLPPNCVYSRYALSTRYYILRVQCIFGIRSMTYSFPHFLPHNPSILNQRLRVSCLQNYTLVLYCTGCVYCAWNRQTVLWIGQGGRAGSGRHFEAHRAFRVFLIMLHTFNVRRIC